MRILLLIVLLLATKATFSQQWCPPGAEWTYNLFNHFAGSGYAHLTYEKDTIILSQPCQKISGYQILEYDSDEIDTFYNEEEYTFSRNDTVFALRKYHNYFAPLYFFNAKKGDTVTFNSSSTCTDGYGNRIAKQIIDSIGIIYINNQPLRFYIATIVDTNAYRYQIGYQQDTIYFRSVKIIERIGAVNNFMVPMHGCHPDEDEYDLRCYSDNSFELYRPDTTIDCGYFYTSISEENKDRLISIFPNPASQSLQLQLSATPPTETYLQLYDATGRTIKQERITEALTTIQRVGIANGIYFWQLNTVNKITGRGKIIFE